MADYFDDALLDDEGALARADAALRPLAEAGARVRRESVEVAEALAEALAVVDVESRPRAVVAAGPDSRLLRAVLEPWCPVPFVAWPGPSLPGWAGALDLVIVLAPDGGDTGAASAIAEAIRRGCQVVVACPPRSLVAEHAAGRHCAVLPASSGDQLATAVVMLSYLSHVDLGPETEPEAVAQALDDVAVTCSPYVGQQDNPAKLLAIAVADSTPVLWGGSVLAARAARRIAETLRRTSGRPALAGDVEHLIPVLDSAQPRDVFADPYADEDEGPVLAPALVVLDDGADDAIIREARGRLVATAEHRGVRVETIATTAPNDVARYAALLATGTYAATYLGVGMGRI